MTYATPTAAPINMPVGPKPNINAKLAPDRPATAASTPMSARPSGIEVSSCRYFFTLSPYVHANVVNAPRIIPRIPPMPPSLRPFLSLSSAPFLLPIAPATAPAAALRITAPPKITPGNAASHVSN